MSSEYFRKELDECVGKYDLLCHPYYKAWTHGQLTKDDLSRYATDYFHFIAALPGLLEELANKLTEGDIKSAVLRNRQDEEGGYSDGRPHKELWLDFAEGMGAAGQVVKSAVPIPEVQALIDGFRNIVRMRSPLEAVAAFYAFESQQPKVSQEKAAGLAGMYGANEKTCGYFTAHAKEDADHAELWLEQLSREVDRLPELKGDVLKAAEDAAKLLWQALDGVERMRQQPALAG